MCSGPQPLVSIITPVHNGAKYLAECIESVLAQTYENWEYVIVDNCSTDQTVVIARTYQRKDARVHVEESDEFLPVISNWNRSLRQLLPGSKYCKILHADDELHPDCLTQMVQVAEANPSVGLVGSYRKVGDSKVSSGFPYPATVVSGRKVCRSLLLGGPDVFGSPSSLLIVSDLIRSQDRFYNESNLHADTEACYDILTTTDFGFVHQVLTYTRRHRGSLTQQNHSLRTRLLAQFFHLQKYGPTYLSEEEYRDRLRRKTTQYYRFLCQQFLRHRDVWRYQRRRLEQYGMTLSISHLVKAFAWLLIRQVRTKLSAATQSAARVSRK